ncbi:MAG: hypothetical protein M1832_004830 [Thelocarpon impressellum]|nr:MAG: hypothetical protein M1832_004830 [Thelocarpon impressellum]
MAAKQNKDVAWYKDEVGEISPAVRKLFEGYSGIAPDRVEAHISEVRDRAWNVWPYPCIGLFRFLDLGISSTPSYAEIIERLKSGQTLLDIGCCFGQEIRKLVSDGAPSENIYGADLHSEFIDAGYDLFQDKGKIKTTFFSANITEPNSLPQLVGKLDMVWAGSFFHLFGWDDQIAVAKRIVELLKPQKGSVIFGRQAGNVTPGEIPHEANAGGTMYRHDVSSFEKLWVEVGKQTGTSWQVKARLDDVVEPAKGGAWNDPNARLLLFAVHRE